MPRRQFPDEHKSLLEIARARFKFADDAESDQQSRENDDIAFENGNQWPPEVLQARGALSAQPNNGLPAVPARPTLVFNKVKEPCRQILNQERASDLGVSIEAADDFGDLGITPDDTEIHLREGLVRRIQRASNAADARTWAFKRAVIAGRGYYIVRTRYLPGKTSDQEVYVERIFNQSSVLLDPSHEQPDGSDSDWGFISVWVPWDRFKAERPKDKKGELLADDPFSDMNENDFMSMSESYPEWYEQDGDHRAVRVTTYIYTDRKSRELVTFADGRSEWAEDVTGAIPEDATKRTVVEKQIKFCKINGGVEVTDEANWEGPDMPIIKVVGEEVLPYDDDRRCEGVVRPARDPQMAENYMGSKYVEVVASTPLSPLIVDPDAIAGYEQFYEQANTRMYPYLPARSWDEQGKQFKEPHRPQSDPNLLPLAQGMHIFDQFVKSATAVPDSTLGNVDPSLKSGRAIREVVANAQQSTSNFIDNLARSVRYEGQVINGLLYPIYGQRPGRLVRILTGEGQSETILISDPQERAEAQAQRQKAAKAAKLTKDAHFNVIVKVSKSYDSRRNELVTKLGDLIAADPTQMGVAGDVFYRNMDIPEAKQLAERQRVMLAPQVQALLEAKEQGKPFDPSTEAKIQALTQQLKHAEAVIQELEPEARGKKVEADTKIRIEAMQADRDLALERLKQQYAIEIQRMKDATAIRQAEIAAETKGIVTDHQAQHEAHALHTELAHDQAMAEQSRAHDQAMAASGMAHEAAVVAGEQDFQAQQDAEAAEREAATTSEATT